MEDVIVVYAKKDAQDRLTQLDSSAFVKDPSGWVEIDRSDSGSRDSYYAYYHAQANYLPDGLHGPDGVHLYWYDAQRNPKYRASTQEEQQQERESWSTPQPAPTIEALQEQLAQQQAIIDELLGVQENE